MDPNFDPYFGACTDDDTAADLDGDGCDWYTMAQDTCGDYDFEDFTASEACCACKPGELISSDTIPNEDGSES